MISKVRVAVSAHMARENKCKDRSYGVLRSQLPIPCHFYNISLLGSFTLIFNPLRPLHRITTILLRGHLLNQRQLEERYDSSNTRTRCKANPELIKLGLAE